jgi:hypothetical protein
VYKNLKNLTRLGVLTAIFGFALSAALNIPAAIAQDASEPAALSAEPQKPTHRAKPKKSTHSARANVSSAAAPDATETAAIASEPQAPARRARAMKSAGMRRGAHPDGGKYFVEFRSRYALSYGHTFLVYGRLNAKGEIGKLSAENVAGLHPAGEGPELWTVGHAIPVPSETGPSDGDTEEEYVSARYRVFLSEEEFRRVAEHIKYQQAHSPLWHAVMYNCNQWVGNIARFMGLQAPGNSLQYPADYINGMRELNKGHDQTPAVTASLPSTRSVPSSPTAATVSLPPVTTASYTSSDDGSRPVR